ncbi:DUF2628 domain-containing protein [Erwinia billingiae]|uniref:DUF2628 domain-containing protein n=1 Tax=Erwinia billingiae TaxID=182337 RepID=UPI0022458D38|nr:DUF2628 domain-containing protein [Erwinia billingiae]MCX0500651.1 DUF2628 domain-containing protein [Erwinia billingiae]
MYRTDIIFVRINAATLFLKFVCAVLAVSAPGFRQALKQLPFKQKGKINFNVIAYFFGPIYLFVLGLWKGNITLILIMAVVYTALSVVFSTMARAYPKYLDIDLGQGFNALYGIITNLAYNRSAIIIIS